MRCLSPSIAILLCLFFAMTTITLHAEIVQPEENSNPTRITKYWLGSFSTNWSDAQNWSGGTLPVNSDDIYITGDCSYYPVTTSSIICSSLTIMPGASLTIGDYSSINVYGDVIIHSLLVLSTHYSTLVARGNLLWQSGSYVISNDYAILECRGDMTFAAGSNVQLLNCEVVFSSGSICRIINHSVATEFGLLRASNILPGYVSLDSTSTQDLTINDQLMIGNPGLIRSTYSGNIFLKGNLIDQTTTVDRGFRLDSGNLVLNGASQQINLASDDRYLNNLVFSQSGLVTLQNNVRIKGDIIFHSGSFVPGDKTIYLGGDWYNYAETNVSFVEEASTVVFDGSGDQYCNVYETFNIIELNKPSGALILDYQYANVQCSYYKWTSGTVKVENGQFLAGSLMDGNIKGNWHLVNGEILLYNMDGRIDLDGNITIEGGHFQVYWGVAPSYWPYTQNASLTMSGGILEIMDQHILINDNNALSLNMNLTGGKIVCNYNFYCYRTDFNPTGGTFEFAGSYSNYIEMVPGSSLSNVVVNKAYNTQAIAANSNLAITGDLTVQRGYFMTNQYLVDCAGDININANSILSIESGGTFSMHPEKSLNINSGGLLYAVGSYTSRATLTNPTGYSYYNIESGGTISARYAIFEKAKSPGLNIKPGATVNSQHNLYYCTFRNGESGGSLLKIDNNQDFTVRDAIFPMNTWNGNVNVVKSQDGGLVCFLNATGDFAGAAYEQDNYNRIFWEYNATPATPELKVLRTEWSDTSPYVGDTIQLKVIWANLSTVNITQNFSLSYYQDRFGPPTPRTPRNDEFLLTGAGPGHMQETIFTITEPSTPGLWRSWLWLDPDNDVTEVNENDNIIGPLNITWNAFAVPVVTDLTIQAIGDNPNTIRLDWTYPATCNRFNIYSDSEPYFQPGPANLAGTVSFPATTWQETNAGEYRFYIVTAEQD